jgi:hypothetical protein
VRVSFEPGSGTKQTFAILGQGVDSVNDAEDEAEDEEEGSKWISDCGFQIENLRSDVIRDNKFCNLKTTF